MKDFIIRSTYALSTAHQTAFSKNVAVVNEVIETVRDTPQELDLPPQQRRDKVIVFKGDYMTVRNLVRKFGYLHYMFCGSASAFPMTYSANMSFAKFHREIISYPVMSLKIMLHPEFRRLCSLRA